MLTTPVQTPVPSAPRPNFVATADDVDLFYRDYGSGRPLLFLSGWTLELGDVGLSDASARHARDSAASPTTGAPTAGLAIPAAATTSTCWPTTWGPCWRRWT